MNIFVNHPLKYLKITQWGRHRLLSCERPDIQVNGDQFPPTNGPQVPPTNGPQVPRTNGSQVPPTNNQSINQYLLAPGNFTYNFSL